MAYVFVAAAGFYMRFNLDRNLYTPSETRY